MIFPWKQCYSAVFICVLDHALTKFLCFFFNLWRRCETATLRTFSHHLNSSPFQSTLFSCLTSVVPWAVAKFSSLVTLWSPFLASSALMTSSPLLSFPVATRWVNAERMQQHSDWVPDWVVSTRFLEVHTPSLKSYNLDAYSDVGPGKHPVVRLQRVLISVHIGRSAARSVNVREWR